MEILTAAVYMSLRQLIEMLGNDNYINQNDSDMATWPR